MTGLRLSMKTVERCVSDAHGSDRRWRPCRTGTFVAIEIRVLEGAPA